MAYRDVHRPLRPGVTPEPRSRARQEAPASPVGDRAPDRQDPGARTDARADAALLFRLARQGGAGAGPWQGRLRQAPGDPETRGGQGGPARAARGAAVTGDSTFQLSSGSGKSAPRITRRRPGYNSLI